MRRPDTSGVALLAWRVAGRLPGPVLRAACDAAAVVAWASRSAGVRRLEANLARVRPGSSRRTLRRLSLGGMRSYLRYYGEAFALQAMSPAQVDARVRLVGREHLEPTLRAEGTVVLALGHLGNWDLAGAWAARNLTQVTTVAEHLSPEELFRRFTDVREAMGLRIIPLERGGDVFRRLVRAARERRPGGGVVPLLADRDLTAHGVEVDLFGQRARVAAGPAALSLATGAPLVAVVLFSERLHGARRRAAGSPWGTVVDVGPALTLPAGTPREDRVRDLTQLWVDRLAAGIARHPTDWHMLQRVFVADLDPERYARTVAAP